LYPIPGPGQDIWEAERREFLYCKRGSEAGDTYKSALFSSWEGHRERRQNGENTVKYKTIK